MELVKTLWAPFGISWLFLQPRHGHRPGVVDVSTMTREVPFSAQPNFYCSWGKERPYWLPIYHRPQNPSRAERGQHINRPGWPYEQYGDHDPPLGGDWIQVVGQVEGQRLRDEHFRYNCVWNQVLVPVERASCWAERHGCQRLNRDDGDFYLGFAADIWMGNTGWRNLPELDLAAITR